MMFEHSNFNSDISQWVAPSYTKTDDMSANSRYSGQLPIGIKGGFK
jgi:hypothetical protein